MILVSGVTGQIGGELARRLAAAGHGVRGLTRDPSKAPASLAAVPLVQGDFEQPETLSGALAGVEKAFFVSNAGPRLAETGGRFFEAAKAAGVRHVVVVSSGTIAIQPPVAIGRWHLALEQRLQATGLAWTMLRPGNFASNVLRWAPPIRAQGAVFHAHGEGKTAPIDPRDIASVAFAALTTPGHEGKTYTLTGSEVVSAREQVEKIGQALGKSLRFVEVPEEGARRGMMGGGMPELMADAILELLRASTRPGESLVTTTVRDVTGVAARTFDDWLRDNIQAFR